VGSGWLHATAHQIVGHWRKAGRRRAGGEAEDAEVQPPEQLALQIST
jgi:hypothetical protein